jgi:excisionase family DNA binding protein
MAMGSTKMGDAVQRYLSVSDAARYSGLSAMSLRRLIASGRLKLYAPTERRRLIDRHELDALIHASVAAAGPG